MPPLVGVAVKVIEPPEHIVVVLAEIVTAGVTGKLTVIVIPLEVAVNGLAHARLLVITHVTICPFVIVDEVNVELFVPTFVPFTCHW